MLENIERQRASGELAPTEVPLPTFESAGAAASSADDGDPTLKKRARTDEPRTPHKRLQGTPSKATPAKGSAQNTPSKMQTRSKQRAR